MLGPIIRSCFHAILLAGDVRARRLCSAERLRQLLAQIAPGLCGLAGFRFSEHLLMRGEQAIPFALVLLDPRRQPALLRRRLLQLATQLGEGLARARLQIGESPLMLGPHPVAFQILLVGARGQAALLAKRLRQLLAQIGLAGFRFSERLLMRGDKTVPLALVLLDPRRQTALLGHRLRQLRLARAELRYDLAVADLQIGDGLAVAGAHEIELSLQLLGAPCCKALRGRRLLQFALMRGDKMVPLALVLLDPRGQTALLGGRPGQLGSHIGQRQALGFDVGERLLVPGAHEIVLLLQFLGAPCRPALLGKRLLQLRAQLGYSLA